MLGDSPDSVGHDPATLKFTAQPIPDFAPAIHPVDRMQADDARDRPVNPDARVKPVVRSKVLQGSADELKDVVFGRPGIDPGHPLPQIFAVAFDKSEEHRRVPLLQQAKLDSRAARSRRT